MSGDSNFFYRIDLPQSAKVTDVTLTFTYNGSSSIGFFFGEINPSTQKTSSIATLVTSGASTAVRTISISSTAQNPILTIDNSQNSYFLSVNFSAQPNSTLWGARVTYTNILGRFTAI